MCCINRGVGAPWSIFNDQQDSLAQRDTGFINATEPVSVRVKGNPQVELPLAHEVAEVAEVLRLGLGLARERCALLHRFDAAVEPDRLGPQRSMAMELAYGVIRGWRRLVAGRDPARGQRYDPAAFLPLFKSGVDVVVCGHNHWAHDYSPELARPGRRLIALGSWRTEPSYLEYAEGEFRLVDPALVRSELDRSAAALVAAGMLVGFGTRLGNGCTSGHGVCGISRGSARSLVATVTFMATGIATAWVVANVFGGRP
jgi:hypothetical protein